MKEKQLSEKIDKSAAEIMRSRREKSGFWHYAQILGVGGWLFVIPVVAGAYLGKYLDERTGGSISWTLTLIIVGIAVGIYNIWYFLFRKSQG
jgi:ATP synthase protein I